MLGKLAQIVSGNSTSLQLQRRRQLMKDLQSIGPITRLLVNPHQVIKRRVAVLARRGEFLEQALCTVHEAGAGVIQGELKRAALRNRRGAFAAQSRMYGNGAFNFAAASKQTAERELNLDRVAVNFGHTREDVGGAVKAIVDEVIEADIVVARQPHRARERPTMAKRPGDTTHDNECECQKQWRQLNHDSALWRSVTDRSIGSVVDTLAQILARLEVRYVLSRQRDRLASLGISALARRAQMQREAAEAADLDALALRQSIAHDLENLLQRKLDILRGQMLLLRCDDLDEFRFRHASPDSDSLREVRSVLLRADLLLQEVAQARAGRCLVRGTVTLHGLGLLMSLLGLDRQRDGARLAIHAGEFRLDLVADLQHHARILDAVTPEFGRAQLSLDTITEIDDRAARIDLFHDATHDRALGVFRDIGRKRILRELLDAERNALPFRVDCQHHGLELLALLVVAYRLFARLIPGNIGQVHKAVDVALQADENAEVGD